MKLLQGKIFDDESGGLCRIDTDETCIWLSIRCEQYGQVSWPGFVMNANDTRRLASALVDAADEADEFDEEHHGNYGTVTVPPNKRTRRKKK